MPYLRALPNTVSCRSDAAAGRDHVAGRRIPGRRGRRRSGGCGGGSAHYRVRADLLRLGSAPDGVVTRQAERSLSALARAVGLPGDPLASVQAALVPMGLGRRIARPGRGSTTWPG